MHFREAEAADLRSLIALLAADPLGQEREDPSWPPHPDYEAAFAAIAADPHQSLLVLESHERVIGMLQLSYIPSLTRRGAWRCQIEGVRIHADFRGQGLGEKLFAEAFRRALARGCRWVQLTSDKTRPDAHRFYTRLGFEASHVGYKRQLRS